MLSRGIDRCEAVIPSSRVTGESPVGYESLYASLVAKLYCTLIYLCWPEICCKILN